MKLDKSNFTTEEFIFVVFLLSFFVMIFVGAFNYRPTARFVPLLLSIPGTILVLLYLLSGYLPESVRNLITGIGEFTFGSSGVQYDNLENNRNGTNETTASTFAPYLIFAFTISYLLLSYLAGFYLSTLTFSIIYLYIARKGLKTRLFSNISLIAILLFIVYVFDVAFGHHFGEGILLNFPWFIQ